MDTGIRPYLEPGLGPRPSEIVTRLRAAARLDHPVVGKTRPKGRRPVWGPRRRAWGYGRMRSCRDKQLRCRWAVRGPQLPVHVLVSELVGDDEPWGLVTSALELTAAQVVEAWAARFRQEDGCRDHNQRLGMEACRAWTQEPILRTFQGQLVALRRLRLLHARRDQAWGAGTWWHKPAWNHHTRHAAILDLRRLFWRDRAEFSPFRVSLEEVEKIPHSPALRRDLPGKAA